MTKEEIEAAITANPEVQTVLTDVLKSKGFNVLTAEDQNKFVEQERARIAAEKTSEIYSALDKDIAETSGFKKDPNEKTYDFLKRTLGHFKTEGSTLSEKIKELEDKIKAGSTDETLKTQLAAYQQKEQELQGQLSEKDQKLFEKDVKFELSRGLSGLKLKSDLPESMVKSFVDTETAKLLQSAKADKDGNIYFVDDQGAPILNDKTQVADAAYILSQRLKDVIDTGRKQQGAGTGNAGKGGTGGFTLPEGLKSMQEVTDTLIKNGILASTPEHRKAFSEYMEKHPNLPLK